MDGQENELATVEFKNKITYIFYWSHLIFASQTLPHHLRCMERFMEAGGLFHLLWLWRTGKSGSCAQFFGFRRYFHGKPQWT